MRTSVHHSRETAYVHCFGGNVDVEMARATLGVCLNLDFNIYNTPRKGPFRQLRRPSGKIPQQPPGQLKSLGYSQSSSGSTPRDAGNTSTIPFLSLQTVSPTTVLDLDLQA